MRNLRNLRTALAAGLFLIPAASAPAASDEPLTAAIRTAVVDAVAVRARQAARPGKNLPTSAGQGSSMDCVTDEELVHRARDGDATAFDEIVERHKGAVFRAAMAALRNREDAEDVTQETFITAFRKLDTFRGESQLRTWLSRIAWNRSMDQRRRGRFRSFLHLDEPDAVELPSLQADPERATLAASTHARVRREIDRLPENLRDTLLLASGGDLDYATIGEMLGVREGTVKSRVFEARAMLRATLEDPAR